MLPDTIQMPDLTSAIGTEAECADRFGLACERAAVPCQFPMPGEVAAAVLRDGLFYDVDATWLRNLASSGGVAGVAERGGRFLWSATALSHAGCLAELFRRFQLHPAHAHKLTAPEVLQAQAEAAGEELFTDIAHTACRDVLAMLAQSHDPNVRGTLAVALLAKMKALGVAER